MKRFMLSCLAVISLLVVAVTPVAAGGWATARLDDPPADIAVEKPWRFGFMVRAHDVTPIDIGNAEIVARHRSGETILRATAIHEGEIGHYVSELTFPEPGEWKWGVNVEAYGMLPFETLVVGGTDQQAKASAPKPVLDLNTADIQLLPGDCTTTADAQSVTTLNPITKPIEPAPGTSELDAAEPGDVVPVWHGSARSETSVEDLIAGSHSLTIVAESGGQKRPIACGAVRGTPNGDAVIVGLAEQLGSGQAGIAMLSDSGDGTDVEVYLVPTRSAGGAAAGESPEGETSEIVIANMGFSPSQVTITAGTTVQWRNDDAVVHSVTGDDVAFSDSPLIDQGEVYSQTFDQPGTYAYRCGPHPNMIGTIKVT